MKTITISIPDDCYDVIGIITPTDETRDALYKIFSSSIDGITRMAAAGVVCIIEDSEKKQSKQESGLTDLADKGN